MSEIRNEVIIGNCRLLLGDCMDLLPKTCEIDAIVTDPPYGIGYDGQKGGKRGRSFQRAHDFKGWTVRLRTYLGPLRIQRLYGVETTSASLLPASGFAGTKSSHSLGRILNWLGLT